MDRMNPISGVTRRDLLKAAAAVPAFVATGGVLRAAETAASQPAGAGAATQPAALPTRALGRTGAQVSVVNMGCGSPPSQRLLDYAYDQGVRYFDTAAGYGKGKSEQEIAKWFERTGKRKEVFLVTKDGVSEPQNLLARIDQRLEALQTDYIDLYFFHGLDKKRIDWLGGDEFKQTAEKLKKSGKVRHFGFSCHDSAAPEILAKAADAGFIDGIMVSYNPVAGKDADKDLDKALDACHKAGIGLIAMKTMRGLKNTVDMSEIGDLNVAQWVIKTTLQDERIASVCSAMTNFKQVQENTAVARMLDKPVSAARVEQGRRALLAAGLAFCPGCEGCRKGIAATHPHVHDAVRYLSYFEQDGRRTDARSLYRALPAGALDVSPADLQAARQACACHVDYPALLDRAKQQLA